MANIKLKLGGDMKGKEGEFTDISSELYRTYVFGTSKVIVANPQYLRVSRDGGHRLVDGEGMSHYIPTGWVHLYWRANPHFVK